MRWIILTLLIAITTPSRSQDPYLFIGTYTNGNSQGIYVYRFNTTTGTGTEVSTIPSDNPSYLAVAPDGKHVYSANESAGATAAVSAYAFDPETGKLAFLNKQSSQGSSTCYIAEDKSQKWVVVANYGSGSLAALPVNSDGSLAPAAQVIRHSGSGINKERQEAPHVHSTIFSPDEKYLYVADLGTDKEYIYHFDPNQSTPLTDAKDSFVSVSSGSGPRHIAFDPGKPYLYLMSEMSGTIDAFRYNANTGKLRHFQRIRTTPESFTGDPGGADIHIRADGKFLYASNRGVSNTLAVFAIGKDGRLTNKQVISVNGKHPRNFAIDPSGHFLLVANQHSNNIVIFDINPVTGLLKPTGHEMKVQEPVCLKFLVP